jgi:hypothetical protein
VKRRLLKFREFVEERLNETFNLAVTLGAAVPVVCGENGGNRDRVDTLPGRYQRGTVLRL